MDKNEVATKTRNIIINKQTYPVFLILTAVLIVLKVTDKIDISWIWIILCPIAPLIMFCVVVAFMLAILVLFVAGAVIFEVIRDSLNK